MSYEKTNLNINKIKKITVLFIFIFFSLLILIFATLNTISNNRKIPKKTIEKKDFAIRGDIISKDNFIISSSNKLYKVSIDTRFLDINKKNLFIKLFSIYSNEKEELIRKKIDKSLINPSNIVLSYNIDLRKSSYLKELNYKLIKLKVFKTLNINDNKIMKALSIEQSGEKRLYNYKDILTPTIGYIYKYESKFNKTKLKGIKGLEKSFNKILSNSKNGIFKGNKDVLSYISFNKKSILKKRVDGSNIILNIPLKLQKSIEILIDKFKIKFKAKEIIVSIMESKTGKILTLASTNRFDPQNIKREDIESLNIKAIEYPYEPGSVLKPITLALLLKNNLVQKDELIYAYNKNQKNKDGYYKNGIYKLGRYKIKDDHLFKKNYLTLDDIIIYSSNIGILQLVQRLEARKFSDGLKEFGLTRKTNIDLPYEKTGVIPPVYKLKIGQKNNIDNVYKATISYGQGMTSTFMQILKAYNVFNNNGYIINPKIVSKISENEEEYSISNKPIKIISQNTTNEIKRMLIKTVQEGTGKETNIQGLEIGGKTGTSQIARNGKYLDKYISSFFGFVNDNKNKYTIGVTVFEPNSKGKYWYHHYASQSAVPIYKQIVKILLNLEYLEK